MQGQMMDYQLTLTPLMIVRVVSFRRRRLSRKQDPRWSDTRTRKCSSVLGVWQMRWKNWGLARGPCGNLCVEQFPAP